VSNALGRSALLALACGCGHPAPPPPAATPAVHISAPEAQLQRRYAGTYVYAGGDAERRAVSAAVEHAISGLSFLAKPGARSSLKQRAEVRDSYTLAFDGLGNATLSSPGFPLEAGPLDGRPVPQENRSQVTVRFVDGVLVQQVHRDDGGGETDFRLTDDGATLLVHRVMYSAQLGAPVDFTLTYRRQ